MSQLNFNAAAVEPKKAFDLVPAGQYVAMITESEVKPNKAGTGQMLKLTFQLVEPPFAGRKVFANLNVQHTNQQAEQIAQAELSAICHAVGVLQLADSAQLHNRPLRIKVGIRKDSTGTYEDQNVIRGYEAVGQSSAAPFAAPAAAHPAQQSFAQPAAAHQPAAGAQTPPWKRNAA